MDLRYEYYPGPGEIISVSAFYKKFKDPVEMIATLGTPELNLFYFNLESSTNRGVEVDIRKIVGFCCSGANWLKKVYISANGSWMKANVKYNGDELLKAAADAGATRAQYQAMNVIVRCRDCLLT